MISLVNNHDPIRHQLQCAHECAPLHLCLKLYIPDIVSYYLRVRCLNANHDNNGCD
jgi:hypothetical protein